MTDVLHARAEAMLKSPTGCAFLMLASTSGLPLEEIARPRNSLYFAGYAASQVNVWLGDYTDVRETVLKNGQQHRDLAIALLSCQNARDWFGPLDTQNQVFVPQDGVPPSAGRFIEPTATWHYAEKARGGIFTSTLADRTCAAYVALDEDVCDYHIWDTNPAPYKSWLVRADPALNPRVYEVTGPDSWHELAARYPAEGDIKSNTPPFTMEPGRITPDWELVATDWDAVHLTLGGLLTADQVLLRSDAGWTYHWSWNIEQTQWLRWVFDDITQLPDHVPPPSAFEYLRHPYYVLKPGWQSG